MFAVKSPESGKIEIVEAPKPVMKKGQALIRTKLLSLCGSDVRTLYYPMPGELPLPVGAPGHEVIGVIEEIDQDGTTLQPGDTVLALAPEHENAMAEYFIASAENVLPLPNNHPLEELLMAQQLGTVIFGCKRLPNLIGKDAVVIGQGSAGLFWVYMLHRLCLRNVIALEIKEARVAAGPLFGATHSINTSREDPLQAVREITGGKMADLVIEACGQVDGINMAPKLVKSNGHLMFFGVPHAPRFEFNYLDFFRQYCFTTTSGGIYEEPGRPSFKMAIDMIAGGEINVKPMITHHFDFRKVHRAYELAWSRDEGTIKVVINMDGQEHPV